MTIWVEFSSPIDKEFEAQSASAGAGSRPAAGGAPRRAQAGDFQISKFNDELSPKLFLHCTRGSIFEVVTIEFYNNATNALYLTYTLKSVVISAFQSNSAGGDKRPLESLALNATSMSWAYFKTSPGP